MVMTTQQQDTVTRLENRGFKYVEQTGNLVLVIKGDRAIYVHPEGTYFFG